MASDKQYLDFILDQLSAAEGVSFRPMMGEYLIYYRDRLIGGVYDNRLLVKAVPSACALLPGAVREAPYPGASPMLLVDEVDNSEKLVGLLNAMYPELPAPKPKKPKVKGESAK